MADVGAAWRRSVASWDGFAPSADRARGGASGVPRRRVLAAGRAGGGQRADGVQGADVVACQASARAGATSSRARDGSVGRGCAAVGGAACARRTVVCGVTSLGLV